MATPTSTIDEARRRSLDQTRLRMRFSHVPLFAEIYSRLISPDADRAEEEQHVCSIVLRNGYQLPSATIHQISLDGYVRVHLLEQKGRRAYIDIQEIVAIIGGLNDD